MTIDFGEGARGCVLCHQPLHGLYWEANGKAACGPCHDRFEASRSGGSPVARFVLAAVYGAVATVAGAVAWWAVARFFNFEAAIVAIGIGWLVGTAVRAGAHARGGILYQLMAVGYTYLSIVLAYTALIIPEMSSATKDRLGILLVPAAFTMATIAPFTQGAASLLSIIIIGVGLMTAWRKNRRPVVAWTGPHAIGSSAPVVDVQATPVTSSPAPSAEPSAPAPPPLPSADGG